MASSIHCWDCHSDFEVVHPEVDYESEDWPGFGLCGNCNTESYGSPSWAAAVGAIDEMPTCSTFVGLCALTHSAWNGSLGKLVKSEVVS